MEKNVRLENRFRMNKIIKNRDYKWDNIDTFNLII